MYYHEQTMITINILLYVLSGFFICIPNVELGSYLV